MYLAHNTGSSMKLSFNKFWSLLLKPVFVVNQDTRSSSKLQWGGSVHIWVSMWPHGIELFFPRNMWFHFFYILLAYDSIYDKLCVMTSHFPNIVFLVVCYFIVKPLGWRSWLYSSSRELPHCLYLWHSRNEYANSRQGNLSIYWCFWCSTGFGFFIAEIASNLT